MANIVDGVALVMPWAGGLVPATLTYNNLVISGIDGWQALIVAGVVEGLGFVAVTTVIDFYEHNHTRAHVDADGMFWIALGGAGLYWLAVFVINTFLDPAATAAKMITGGILSTFGVLGGVMVALRNQLGKRRQALELAESRARMERTRLSAADAEKGRMELEFDQKLKAEQLRFSHELEMEKQAAESARKLEKVRALQAQTAPILPAVQAQSEVVRRMVQCSEPGCGMQYAAVGGKGGHYKKWHLQAVNGGVA